MAAANPRLAFSIDDSATSSAYKWRSCLGDGNFELIGLDEFHATAAARLGKAFPDNPEWNQGEWIHGLGDAHLSAGVSDLERSPVEHRGAMNPCFSSSMSRPGAGRLVEVLGVRADDAGEATDGTLHSARASE
jgi:hypothetical protein